MEKNNVGHAPADKGPIPHAVIVAGFGLLLCYHLVSFLFWRQDFWGEAALLRLAPVLGSTAGAQLLFVTALVLVFAWVTFSLRRRFGPATVAAFFLWALMLFLHRQFWPILNAGETFLILILPFLALDQGRGRGALVVQFLLGLIFMEAGLSKAFTGAWLSGMAPQWILSGDLEVRPWVDALIGFREINPASIRWRVFAWFIIGGELLVAAFSFLWLWPRARAHWGLRRGFLVLACGAHLVSAFLFDLSLMPFVFLLSWLWTLNASNGWVRDLWSMGPGAGRAAQRAAAWICVVLAFLPLVFIGARFRWWTEPQLLKDVAVILRYNRNWRLFQMNEDMTNPSIVDLEIEGQPVFLNQSDPSQPLTSSLYGRYPGREYAFYLAVMKRRQKNPPMPSQCPARVLSSLAKPAGSGDRLRLDLVQWRMDFGRRLPPSKEVVWTRTCTVGSFPN